jgi:MFS family permease
MTLSPPVPGLAEPRVPLLRRRSFQRFWAAQTISLGGDQITLLALPLAAVLRLGATPGQMGLLTAAGWLPHLLLSLVAGAWIDQRQHRRRIMVWADLGRAVVLLSVPVAAFAGVLSLGQLYAVAFACGCCTVFFDQSWSSSLMTIVERSEVAEAQSRLSTSRAATQVAGPGVAGWLVELVGAPFAVLLDAASYVASALLLRGVRTPEPVVVADPEPLRARLLTGLRFVRANPMMRAAAVACGLINFFDMMLMAVLVLFLSRRLHLSPGVIGTVLAGGAVGAVFGAVVAPRVAARLGLGRTIALGGFGMCAAPFALVLAAGPRPVVLGVLVLGQVVCGIAVMLFDVNLNAVLALSVPHRLRGRSAGAMRLLAYGPRPLGAVTGGFLGGAIGLGPTLWAAALGGVAGALVVWWSPVRRLTALPPQAE